MPEVREDTMTDFINPWIVALAWTLACVVVWSWLVVAKRADEESEKMGRLRRVK